MTAPVARGDVRRRSGVLATMLALIALPGLVALTEAAAFYRANGDNGVLVSSGVEREYLLYVPPSYRSATPTPLVISLHGGALWGAVQAQMSQWSRIAEREGFIVVYPSGVRGDGPRHWRMGREPDSSPDVVFIGDLIDTLSASFNIDAARIYADGLSNGGGMAFALSCTMPNRIAAVGMVGAAHLVPWSWCRDLHPVPMVAFHGTADNAAPYNGGASWVTPKGFPSIRGWTARWALRNGCDSRPVDSVVAADVTRRAYGNCALGADVVLYTIHGGGHTWPGGGRQPEWFLGATSRAIDASAVMWKFYQAHPLRVADTSLTPH